MSPKDSPLPKPKSPAVPTATTDPNTLVSIELPLHYAAIVQNSLERSLQAQGRQGARMLLTILDSFADAVGDYQIPEPEAQSSDAGTE